MRRKAMLTENQKMLLHKLIEKSENRSSYGDNSKRANRVMITLNEKEFPDYFHVSESQHRRNFNFDAIELEKLGFANCEWQKFSKGEELRRLILVEELLPEIYTLLGRQTKAQRYKEMEQICLEYFNSAPPSLHSFYEEMLMRISTFESLPSIFSFESHIETNKALYGLNELFKNDRESSKRKWSILLYRDSKEWEKLEKRIISVIRKYILLDIDEYTDDDIFQLFGISQKPMMVKLFGKFSIQTETGGIEFQSDRYGVGIHPTSLQIRKIVMFEVDAVVTIENETSYYDYVEYCHLNKLNHLVIYLGGFHNSARRMLLVHIYDHVINHNLRVKFFHWGDIDLGGMLIWRDLCNKTGIPFIPYKMDGNTYIHFHKDGKVCLSPYLNKLSTLLDNNEFIPFHDVIKLILEHKRRIEQEIVILTDD
jgi:hypothetical protein